VAALKAGRHGPLRKTPENPATGQETPPEGFPEAVRGGFFPGGGRRRRSGGPPGAGGGSGRVAKFVTKFRGLHGILFHFSLSFLTIYIERNRLKYAGHGGKMISSLFAGIGNSLQEKELQNDFFRLARRRAFIFFGGPTLRRGLILL
jgi:hypothetical protein